jgi:hypothetical protein
MKIYNDAEMRDEIEVLDFGIVRAGVKKDLTLYIKNDTEAVLQDLTYKFPDAVKGKASVVSAPENLMPGASGELQISWTPSATLRKALRTRLVIEGEEIYVAEE